MFIPMVLPHQLLKVNFNSTIIAKKRITSYLIPTAEKDETLYPFCHDCTETLKIYHAN